MVDTEKFMNLPAVSENPVIYMDECFKSIKETVMERIMTRIDKGKRKWNIGRLSADFH